MSCGTKIDGRYGTYSERLEISNKLESQGEHSAAYAVRRGECLDYFQLRRAEDVLGRQGMSRRFDYRTESCECEYD